MEDDDEDSDGIVALGFLAHWWLTVASFVRRRLAARRAAAAHGRDAEPFAAAPQRPRWSNRASDARIEPDFAQTVVREPVLQMDPFDDEAEDDDICPATEHGVAPVPGNAAASAPGAAARVEAPAPRPAPGARVQREAQTSLIGSEKFEMPSLHFLCPSRRTWCATPACPRTRWSRTPACSKACWRISASRARSSMSAPARSSPSTSWSRRPASNPSRVIGALPTTSPAR